MSADTLRRAAALMRERAEAATNYPWAASDPGTQWRHYDGQVTAIGFPDDFDPSICDALDNDDAQHIASWHPAVALAVADWLDDTANANERLAPLAALTPRGDVTNRKALAVARAYLGSES